MFDEKNYGFNLGTQQVKISTGKIVQVMGPVVDVEFMEAPLPKIKTDNADFDVDYHEAIAMVPGMGDDKKGKVIDCVQTGYTLNDKVIRHAKVAVGQ